MTIIEQIISSPEFPEYVREFNDILENERAERRRFYDVVHEHQKAEFINGRMIVQSPARFEHISTSDHIFSLLKAFVQKHGLGKVLHEKALVALKRNDYEPDVAFFGAAKAAKLKEGQLKFPPPDLAVEVLSPGTEGNDRSIKFDDYALHGVQEYWIVDPRKRTIEQFVLRGRQYELKVKVKDGTIHSRAIKGLEFPVRAAFDEAENFRAVQAVYAGGRRS